MIIDTERLREGIAERVSEVALASYAMAPTPKARALVAAQQLRDAAGHVINACEMLATTFDGEIREEAYHE